MRGRGPAFVAKGEAPKGPNGPQPSGLGKGLAAFQEACKAAKGKAAKQSSRG